MPQVTKNTKVKDFEAISVSVASPEDIYSWSYGEVVKPETINYRTQKPERGGLFCEKIFGPTKNWQCYCGKYKRVRYEGVVCEKCGVEVTRNIVRRERMAHIKLAVPVTHIWYLRSTPSRIGLLLDLPVKQIEQVVYFAAYIVTDLSEDARVKALVDLEEENKSLSAELKEEHQAKTTALKAEKPKDLKKQLEALDSDYVQQVDDLKENFTVSRDDLSVLRIGHVLSEIEYRSLAMKFGHVFKVGIGAEGIREIIEKIDLDKFIAERKEDLKKTSGQKQKKIVKRLKLASNFKQSGIKPEWIVLTVLPVIPPDLRPMVQLDGGRFAASDLNDLYRRVINRNNRLKRLIEINAPEVICRNEKRMLQEAVDALLNSDARQGKTTFNVNERRKLRSLSDMLKGKQGRFRQNLLGKRVDYSGRSVIVVGPNLKLHQCGLPKEMALKLFKPMVIGELMKQGLAYNLKNAERVIASNKREVWDILEKVTSDRYVLLNRAPTLHRLGIQAFQPVLIDGKAIQIHPLVCTAFNADFDGDQMAVHLPLSAKAQHEAKTLIASNRNLLKPSSGSPVTTPTRDMLLGCYYVTKADERIEKSESVFVDKDEALRAYALEKISLQQRIDVRIDGAIIETTVGKILFNNELNKKLGYINDTLGKKQIEKLVARAFNELGEDETVELCDYLKTVGFHYATLSGISMGYHDMKVPEEKEGLILATEDKVRRIINMYWKGYITDSERYHNVVTAWLGVKKEVAEATVKMFDEYNHISYIIDSGARGGVEHLTQLAGMKGSVASPSGRILELPISSNLLEGFSILEFFIAAHSGRKGKADTALKTASSGYLTRKLVDSVQTVLVKQEDCGTEDYRIIKQKKSQVFDEDLETKIFGRILAGDVVDKATGEQLLQKGTTIGDEEIDILKGKEVGEVHIRAVTSCVTDEGVCQRCYGNDMSKNSPIDVGTAVGVLAAQSIGEPGTQLTMRTFHAGGSTGGADITMGLGRVEELLEARTPKTPAYITEASGVVSIKQRKDHSEVVVKSDSLDLDEYFLHSFVPAVKVGEIVKDAQIIARSSADKNTIKSRVGGRVEKVTELTIEIRHTDFVERAYKIPSKHILVVKDGARVELGDKLTEGHLDLAKNMELKGIKATQEYIISDVQAIYMSQGQSINDKHLEVIVKQIFSRVRIINPGDTEFLPEEIINLVKVDEVNRALVSEGKKPALYERLLYGLTKAAMSTESWLSAASFQETIRVLVEASIRKQMDHLNGLKENVIIGKPIPTGENFYKKNVLTIQ